MGRWTKNRIKLRKIFGVGFVLQIFIFSVYLALFQTEHDVNGTRVVAQSAHFSRNRLIPLSVNQTKSEICNESDGNLNCAGKFIKVTSSCDGLIFPKHILRRNTWQKIDEGGNGYAFSAYFDRNTLTILGVTSAKLGPVTCQLWYLNNSTSDFEMEHVNGNIQGLPEGHGKRFTAAYFKCTPPANKNIVPYAVSVVKEKCNTPSNVLPVTVTKDKLIKRKFTICLTPFNFRYGRAYELIEWIEFNRILGVDYFVFYNYSVAPNVEKVLQSYIKQNIVEVVDWHLPMSVATWPPTINREEIHYFGQLGSLNECLLRSRGRTEFIANLDLDEFIIPRKKDVTTWHEMLASQPDTGSYVFANVFFRKEWNTSSTNFFGYENAKKYKLVTLLQTQHEKTVFNFKTRSKYIAKPYSVEILGIHNIWRHGGRMLNVPHDVGLLHHYRNWLKYNDKQARVTDDIIVKKFKDKLLDSVIQRWNTLTNVEFDIPLCDHPKEFGAC